MEEDIKISYETVFDKIKQYISDEKELSLIEKSYEFANDVHSGEKRLSGEDAIMHPLGVVYILTRIHTDYESICAAFLHETLKCGADIDEIEREFGSDIATLVKNVDKINRISLSAESEYQVNYYKKILVGLCEDVRVIIIKLADRLDNLKTLWAIPEEHQKEKAKETLEILAPIAHRLGIHYIKSGLEDLSLRYLKPDVYYDIVTRLNNTKKERDNAISEMKASISEMLNEHNIKHEIKGRSKSIYSIYNKMQNGKKFEEIYDILALRVYVETESECYLALGLIHSKYKPLSRRFKDYIAMPKENMYQSLHTTIYGVLDELYEVQIRTYEMDKIAEYGIASHWSYKEKIDGSVSIKNVMEQKLQMFRNIIENSQNVAENDEEFVSIVKEEALTNDIYVYTPKGDVIELPLGSTPIDFAYKVHTDIGDKMVGAIVNDSIVPLDYKLKDGDIVKVNVNKNSKGPSKEWLNIVFTSQAKNRIKSFYTRIDKNENIKKGQDLIEKELRKNKIPFIDFTDNVSDILKETNEENLDDLYLSVGNNKFTPTYIVNILKKEEKTKEEILLDKISSLNVSNNTKKDIIVDGIDEIKVTLANCCKPVKGDDVIGYITKGNGIVVHRTNCHNIENIDDRVISINWNMTSTNKYSTYVVIKTEKKDNLLVNIVSIASSNNVTISTINVINNPDYITYDLVVLVENNVKLKAFLNSLYQMSEVIEAERLIK